MSDARRRTAARDEESKGRIVGTVDPRKVGMKSEKGALISTHCQEQKNPDQSFAPSTPGEMQLNS